MASYDKGFGGSRQSAGPQRHRQEPTAHGAAATPAHAHREFGEHIPGDAPHGVAVKPRRSRPWADHAGSVGLGCASVGFLGGIGSVIAWGNWYALLVLPVMLGLAGAITFWLFATVADVFRRVR